jgi:hypothetical protein
MDPKAKVTAKHEHVTAEVGPLWEYCRCGAIRHRMTVGSRYQDPWHVCDRCRHPGFAAQEKRGD